MLGKSLLFLLGLSSLFFIQSSSHLILWGMFALLLSLISVLLKFNNKNSLKLGFVAFGVMWAVITVFFWSSVANNLIESPAKVKLSGSICGIPTTSQNSSSIRFSQVRFEFCVESIEGENIGLFTANKVVASWRNYSGNALPDIKAGQSWLIEGKLKPVHGKSNPGNFDYERWMISNGIAGTLSIRNGRQLVSTFSLANYYRGFRQQLYDKIVRASSVNSRQSLNNKSTLGLVLAISMGERSLIDDDQMKAFVETGTSHLLAISGLHIGIAALWSYWLISYVWRLSCRLCLVIPAQTAGQFGSLLGAISLLFVSGFGLPAIRATLMLSIFILSRLSFRSLSLRRTLGITIFVVCILNPLSILSASFWLSFFAVFVISIVVNRQFQEVSKLFAWFKVNWYLYLLLIPITLLFFGYFNIASIFANLVLIPLVSFVITPLCFIAVLLISSNLVLGEILLIPADYLMNLMVTFQTWLSSFHLLGIYTELKASNLVLLFLLVSIGLLPKKLISLTMICPIVLTMILLYSQPKERMPLEVFIFDIGQGLAIYIENADGNLLYDTGWGSDDYSLAKSVLIPFFESRRIKKLDKLVVSHGDADHAGGLNHILNTLKVSEVISGEPIKELESFSCHGLSSWIWGNSKFEFLQHVKKQSVRGNNSSCVLSIRHNAHAILLTGDIEKSAEKRLVKNTLSNHHVLVAPHHGSKTSSTIDFIDKVNPSHVIFSTGYANQWSFPRKEVVDRYLSKGSKIWTTHIDGAIRLIITENDELKVDSWRQISPHFWSETKMRSIITK